MTKVGIYCPDWIVARHNTDYKIAKILFELKNYVDIETLFVAAPIYTWSFNINKIIKKLTKIDLHLTKHHFRKIVKDIDVLYHYGDPADPAAFFKKAESLPVFITTGFMTDRYMIERLGFLNDRQKEADQLAKKLEQASMLHFHTQNGRQRFLSYRPEFENKTVTIPFFLPSLSRFQIDHHLKEEINANKQINILFVGNEGSRKGLNELIEALDTLGTQYLNAYNIHVTIVSKDKPYPKSNFPLTWYVKQTHDQIIDLMKKASIFVLVPKRESYGVVLVEAMMAGCAIITDDDDTRKEILNDTAVLLSSNIPSQIASSLKALIEDNNHRISLGRKASERAKKTFLPEAVALKYNICFSKLSR